MPYPPEASWLSFSASESLGAAGGGAVGGGGVVVGSVGAEILFFGKRNEAGAWLFGWGQRGRCWVTLKPRCSGAT